MNNVYEKLMNCYNCVREKIDFVPKVAIVLGSGLGDYAEKIKVEAELSYSDIKGFPVSTVPGHAGKFIFERQKNMITTTRFSGKKVFDSIKDAANWIVSEEIDEK